MTEFWGYVLPTRAGLVTPKYYREILADSAAEFDNESGASWRPLVDTATAAQVLYPAPDSWGSARRGVDFYDASMFLWYDVDAELRARTDGKATLDTFVQKFYAGPAGAPQVKPYVEADIYATLNSIAPNDWRAFIHRHLDSKNTDALLGMFKRSGWKLEYDATKNDYIEFRQKLHESVDRFFSIGLRLSKDGEITDTAENRAAAKAGIGPGMKLIAVNGKKYDDDVLDAALIEAQKSHRPIELLVENADFYRTFALPYYDGPRYPHLVRDGDGPDQISAVLAPRVK
jgi:predicted metalloprotease with PDZ domain